MVSPTPVSSPGSRVSDLNSAKPQIQNTKPDFLSILGQRIDRLTFAQTLQQIKTLLSDPAPHHVITANTLMLLEAEKDAELTRLIKQAALVVPESWGIYWASRRLGAPLEEFIPGIDLMLALCSVAAAEGLSIYLLGARPGVAEGAAKNLQESCPGLKIAGTHHGYFSSEKTVEVIRRVREVAPTFLFVGMSVPGQEKWIARHLNALGASIVMGVGGSFDVLSGRLRRAPAWMRQAGIEWAFRLAQEPWRWRRIAQLPVFMAKILRQTMR